MDVRFAAAALAAAAFLASSANAEDVRATHLIGMGVFDSGGKEIARIDDLAIDPAKQRVTDLLLAVGTREYRVVKLALPVKGARARPEGGLVIDGATREQMTALPDVPAQPPQPAEGEAPPTARKATDILRAQLLDREGRDIGDVEDLIVKLEDGAVLHVVLKFDPSWHPGPGLFAFPIGRVEPSGPNFIAKFRSDDILAPGQKPPPPQAAAPPPPPPIDPEARLTQLLGARVEDAAGTAVGVVKDVAIDASKKEVSHIVVSQAAGAVAAFELPRTKAKLADGKPVVVVETAAGAAVGPDGTVPRRMPGSRLLRSEIADPNGKDVGNIEDVVVNLRTGKLHFAVAEFNPNWVAQGWLVAIPVRPLKKTGDESHLAMQFNLNELNRAYLFQKGQWPDVNDRAFRARIDQHIRE